MPYYNYVLILDIISDTYISIHDKFQIIYEFTYLYYSTRRKIDYTFMTIYLFHICYFNLKFLSKRCKNWNNFYCSNFYFTFSYALNCVPFCSVNIV